MISQRKRVDESLWKRLLQRLYPAGNDSVLEKLQDIYLGRKLLLEQEYASQQHVRRLSREQELSVKKIIRDDARILFPEILACILEQQM